MARALLPAFRHNHELLSQQPNSPASALLKNILVSVLNLKNIQLVVRRGQECPRHTCYSNSAFATGCGAVGPSPKSVSSIFLPFSVDETAVSIINSASRVVP